MTRWVLRGIELPSGEDGQWFIDEFGRSSAVPLDDAEPVPGRFVLRGLVDSHAHPAIAFGPNGPIALNVEGARATLVAWAQSGVVLARDVGSPGGLTLTIPVEPGLPRVHAAGRFLAPANRYFPELLVEPVSDDELVDAALAEVARGASWVKVIGDFPNLKPGSPPEPTYPIELIEALANAVHMAGSRVAVHSTLGGVASLVSAGVDSIEHGFGLDEDALHLMARTGAAWTPTLSALVAGMDDDSVSEVRRASMRQAWDRVRTMLPLAVKLGVPVLAGTDVVGTLAKEVVLLSQAGLTPDEALAAATTWPKQFLHVVDDDAADFVTFATDPRDDEAELAQPLAVFIDGVRIV